MDPLDHPAVPLGLSRMPADTAQAVATRVRMVLETQPGTLPWRPQFGCDLERFVGEPATTHAVRNLQRTVRASLERWLPEIQVRRCEIRLQRPLGHNDTRPRNVPLAEAALVRLGVQTDLVLDLDLETDEGVLGIQANLSS